MSKTQEYYTVFLLKPHLAVVRQQYFQITFGYALAYLSNSWFHLQNSVNLFPRILTVFDFELNFKIQM